MTENETELSWPRSKIGNVMQENPGKPAATQKVMYNNIGSPTNSRTYTEYRS